MCNFTLSTDKMIRMTLLSKMIRNDYCNETFLYLQFGQFVTVIYANEIFDLECGKPTGNSSAHTRKQ